MKQIYARCLSMLLLTLFTIAAYAQNTVTGTVKDAKGEAIPAVSILVKGSTQGVSSDAEGKFRIAAAQGSVLIFRYIGYKTQEVTVGTSNTINVVLADESNNLNEVVVTALGIQREKKSLGYAVQEVKGESLVEAREPNVVNTLSGKVSGLQVTRSSNGPAGSSKITLRGNNSLTGDNQPLIVIDGVPVNNFTGATNNDYYNPSIDYGNGLSDINSEDIESVSVLKGPSASALYGSRAGNGVILITTKSGRIQKGLGIAVSSTFGIEDIFTRPKMQNDYAQGDQNGFDPMLSTSWGPKITGQTVTNWRGEQEVLSAHDNLGNYADQGFSSNQSVSLQQQYKSTSVYTSFNRLDDRSMIPGAKLQRTNLLARAISKFGEDDKWTVDTKVQYSNSDAQNRPASGANPNNVFATLYQFPRSLDIRQLNPSVDPVTKQMIWYNTGPALNPYWAKDYNLNQDVRDRYLLNGSLKYQVNSWLNAEIKAGADKFSTTTEGKLYGGSPSNAGGLYSLGKQTFTETNFSFLLSGQKDNLIDRLGGNFTVGGNLMSQKNSALNGNSGQLNVPNLFSLNNGINNPTVEQLYNEKRINSLYGTLGVNWDGYLFLDGTFRNDWTSTLHPDNRSFFYPSLNLSLVVTEMLSKLGTTVPEWITYAKIRGSAASVGNDLPPYQLYNTYNIGKDPNGNTTGSRNEILFDPYVKNELIKSYEAGADLRLFKSRLGLDFSIYKSNATNQLLNLPLDPLSGYRFMKINSGDIQNTGIEITLDGRILESENGLNWNMGVNFSRNKNTVVSIKDDIELYRLGGFDDVGVFAKAGAKYGEIYGSTFRRVEDNASPFYGQLLLDANGLPQVGDQNVRLGNQQADALLGITNTFSYKGFNLSFLIDGRFGGKIFSSTLAQMQRNGTSDKTVVNGMRDNIVTSGAILNTTTNQFEQNTKAVTPQQYWAAVAGVGNLGITEANLYDASNIRIRNINLAYNFSPKMLEKTFIQRAKLGVSCNNVWLITSHMNGLDPESVFATNTNATGFENGAAPTSRSFSFNLTLGF
ncbi:SusC/RagA family TonB-linked outer membrane protein [Pedobacter sp. SAFR-022]|uniref:SusC/RagA family TonB-linked outer membrane protein n=1 Tax=Pedobacter sp. SAFR-022 TaxID=3436861 RepID=UPI003F8076FD